MDNGIGRVQITEKMLHLLLRQEYVLFNRAS